MTGGIGGLPATPIVPCDFVPPDLEWSVIQDRACRVDVIELTGYFDMSAIDAIQITTNGPNSPLTFTTPFVPPLVQTSANAIAIVDPSLCEVDITSIEIFSGDDDIVVSDGIGPNWTTDKYVASAVGTDTCELTITADKPGSLSEIGSIDIDINGNGTVTFVQPFLPGDGNTIVINDGALCNVTLDELRFNLGVSQYLAETVAGPVVIP